VIYWNSNNLAVGSVDFGWTPKNKLLRVCSRLSLRLFYWLCSVNKNWWGTHFGIRTALKVSHKILLRIRNVPNPFGYLWKFLQNKPLCWQNYQKTFFVGWNWPVAVQVIFLDGSFETIHLNLNRTYLLCISNCFFDCILNKLKINGLLR
jgi:hypothetical protein